MSNNRYVICQARPLVTITGLNTAKTFIVAMEGMDTLILDIDLDWTAATALVFSFTGRNPNDSKSYGLTVTNYASQTIANASLTYSSISGDISKRFVFSIPAAGIPPGSAGNITVTITATAGDAADVLVITPYVARTGG